jgi:hypothetical protein
MTSAALIGAGDDGEGTGALAASASDAASAHAPIKTVTICEGAGRGTGRILPQIARHKSREVFVRGAVKLSKIHGMLAHRAKTAPTM